MTVSHGRAALAFGLAATALAAVLYAIATRGEPQLGHDPFYYLEIAQHLAEHAPAQLGVAWPYGYPFLASLWVRAGLHPYPAAVIISWLGFYAAFALFAWDLLGSGFARGRVLGIVLVLACLPAVFRSGGAVLTDMLFAALVYALLAALQRAESPAAWLASLLCVIALLCTRYVGLALIALPAAWLAGAFRELTPKARAFRLASLGATAAILLALLWTNVRATGHLTGIPREPDDGSVLGHVSHYGWSLWGLLHSSPRPLADRLPGLAATVGFATCAALALLCGYAVVRERTRRARLLALAIAVYSAALIAARSLGRFDDLSVGRFFLPALFPACALVASLPVPRWLERAAAVAIVAIAVGTVSRPPSAQTAARVDEARTVLEPLVSRDSVVLLNDNAITLAASLDADATWIRDPASPLPPASFLVVAARSQDRQGSSYTYEPPWLERVAQLERSGWTTLLHTPRVHVLRAAETYP